jgi:DNA-binding MarR family transcriptional regulator
MAPPPTPRTELPPAPAAESATVPPPPATVPPPPSTQAATELASELLAAARQLVSAAARAAGPGERAGLTGAQFDLLLHIGRNPGEPVARAATRLGLARNTVSTLVGQLCQAGLLERVPDPDDGRVARLWLQPAAEQRMSAWRSRRVAAVRAALDRCDEADRRVLTAALPALHRTGLELGAATARPGESAEAMSGGRRSAAGAPSDREVG